jgi:glycosyltransferase involved in cell wall biosynthesis
MNILLLTEHFFPNIGGGEFVVHYWAKYLVQRGHTVVLPVSNRLYPKIRHMKFNYTLEYYKSYPYVYNISKMATILMQHRKYKFDVVHANFLYPPGYMGLKIQKLLNIPCFATAQGADIKVYPPLKYGNLLNPKIFKRTVKVLKHSAGLIYTCTDIKNIMVSMGASDDKMYYAVSGSPHEEIISDKKDIIREQLQIKHDELMFVLVSRNSKIKGLSLMIDAVEDVIRYHTKFKVVIIGLETESLTEVIRQKGLEKYIHILGEVPIETDPVTHVPKMPSQIIIDYLCAADVFVSPALSGGFELSAMDAMSAGLAVILSDNIGNRDLVEQGKNGFVFENNNASGIVRAMSEMIADFNRTKLMGQINKDLSKKYSWSKVAEALEFAYIDVIKKWKK